MADEKNRKTVNLVQFAPQHWGEVERFSQFWTRTYSFDRMTQKRLRGIVGHYRKAGYMLNLARRQAPGLDIDSKQLEEQGYSPAHNAKELAAIIETVYCEQYSVLDCARAVLQGVYSKHKGIRKSTRSTFQAAFDDSLDSEVPSTIRDALKQAKEWYPRLLRLRDELTHSNIGACHKDKETGEVFYMHDGLGTPGKSLVINDVFSELDQNFDRINALLGTIFKELNSTLSDEPIEVMCGIFGGRFYQRIVRPHEAIDTNAGTCKSHTWFDLAEHPDCPLKDNCKAYSRAKGDSASPAEV